MFSPVVVKTFALTALNFVLSLGGKWLKSQKADSLIRFTKSTRVEPIALVDQRLSHLPFMTDVMQSLSSIFTGYYLQAVALAVNVGSVNVVKLLDALNPSRDVHDAAATHIVDRLNEKPGMLSMESYRYGLPVPGEAIGLEAFGDTLPTVNAKNNAFSTGKDTAKAVNEAVNLSVGKLIEVTVEDDGKKAMFPIMIRLISSIVGSDTLVHILGDGSRNVSYKERYHAWRAGQLEFIRDLVLCQDLIDEHRAALMKDKSGVYAEILNRRTGNSAANFFSGSASVGTASNLVILSKQTVKELEASIEGRISNFATREKIFKNTYIMILVVIDTEWEQITFYHRGIAIPTEMSLKELKTANKGTGPDVGEILKAYQLGNNPTI